MQPEPTFDSQLVDLHLGRLNASEQVELNLRIAADPTLQQQHETLAGVFKALNSNKADPAPPDLAMRVAARVAAAGRRVRLVRPTDNLTRTVERGTPVILRLGNMREIVAAAAMIVLMVGFAVPSLLHMREHGRRHGVFGKPGRSGDGCSAVRPDVRFKPAVYGLEFAGFLGAEPGPRRGGRAEPAASVSSFAERVYRSSTAVSLPVKRRRTDACGPGGAA